MAQTKKATAADVAGAVLNLRELVFEARDKLAAADVLGAQLAEALDAAGDTGIATLVETATCLSENSIAPSCSAGRSRAAIDESLSTLDAIFGRLAAGFADPRR